MSKATFRCRCRPANSRGPGGSFCLSFGISVPNGKMDQTMKLPQREFYTLHEVAARWGCALADISGWSTAGELDVITGIPPTFCGTTRVAGTVVVCTMDILPMFRRTGTGPQNAHLRRLRVEEATLTDDEKAAFYAKMVNADGYLPQSVISNTIRDAMLVRGLVTPERLRQRGVR